MLKSPPTEKNLVARGVLFVALLLAMSLFYLLVLRPSKELGRQHPAVGHTLVRLQLQPLFGDAKPLSNASLKGRISLVNFWGPWCPPCREEFPQLAVMAEHMKADRRFQYISVSCGQGADNDGAELEQLVLSTKRFLSQQDARFPVWVDGMGATRKAAAIVSGANGFVYPTTILLDEEGVIRGYWAGYLPGIEREMESLARSLLNHLVQNTADADSADANNGNTNSDKPNSGNADSDADGATNNGVAP